MPGLADAAESIVAASGTSLREGEVQTPAPGSLRSRPRNHLTIVDIAQHPCRRIAVPRGGCDRMKQVMTPFDARPA